MTFLGLATDRAVPDAAHPLASTAAFFLVSKSVDRVSLTVISDDTKARETATRI